jgi:hypothetical protein
MLSFLNPTLAAVGLLCVAVPILIHILMRRKRRPVAWGAMRFIAEAYRRQRRRMNLEQILLLLCRCALVALVAFAVGKPLLGGLDTIERRGPQTLYIVLDTSMSGGVMSDAGVGDAGTAGGSRTVEFEGLRTRALELVQALDSARGDRVAIITTGMPAEGLILPPSGQLAAAQSLLREIKLTQTRGDWQGAISMVKADRSKQEAGRVTLALLSRWRGGVMQTPMLSLGDVGGIDVVAHDPAEAAVDNITITAVEPARTVVVASAPGQSDVPRGDVGGMSVRVSLARSGPGIDRGFASNVMLTTRALVGALPGGAVSAPVMWEPGQRTADVFLTLPPPALPRNATLSDRASMAVSATIDNDSLTADNAAHAAILVREQIDAAVIGGGGSRGEERGISGFSAADWFRLALAPAADQTLRTRQGGDVRVTLIDPVLGIAPSISKGGVGKNAGLLSPFDVIVIADPSGLDSVAWAAVKEQYDTGATVVVCPSAEEGTQLWGDPFLQAFGLEWRIARDPTVLTSASTAGETITQGWGQGQAHPLLALIAGELPDLLRSVSVQRVLELSTQNAGAPSDDRPPMRGSTRGPSSNEEAGAQGFDTLLYTQSGKPLLVSAAGGRGTLLMFTAAMDVSWTDLPARPLIVPLMQELVRQSVGRAAAARTVVAGSVLDGGSFAGAMDLQRVGETSGTLAIQGGAALRTEGVYAVRGSDGSVLGALAVNPDPGAGDVTLHSREAVAAWLRPLNERVAWLGQTEVEMPGNKTSAPNASGSVVVSRSEDSPPMSWPLLVIAGVLAVIELVCARIFSHADQRSFAGVSRGPSETAAGAPVSAQRKVGAA